MAKIWANRLIGGTKFWEQVPASRKASVLEELRNRVESGEISAERFEEITGQIYSAE